MFIARLLEGKRTFSRSRDKCFEVECVCVREHEFGREREERKRERGRRLERDREGEEGEREREREMGMVTDEQFQTFYSSMFYVHVSWYYVMYN